MSKTELTRRQSRIMAFQSLYSMDFNDLSPDQAIEHVLQAEGREEEPSSLAYIKQLVAGVKEHGQAIDSLLNQHLDHWTVDRLDRVDRLILGLGVYEILYVEDVPPQVSIDEMIEISKQFSNEESRKLVNAVLDSIANESQEEGIR